MAFEKMTAEELFHKFWDMYGRTWPFLQIKVYNKIGARMLRIEMTDGHVLYFLWYDENNWNLGTKPYRKRPVKQMERQLRNKNTFNDLKNNIETLPPETNLTMEEAILQMKIAEAKGLHEGFSELITNGNDVIATCNQWGKAEEAAEEIGNTPLEPIDWVKEDSMHEDEAGFSSDSLSQLDV